jgi:hypothetical protein
MPTKLPLPLAQASRLCYKTLSLYNRFYILHKSDACASEPIKSMIKQLIANPKQLFLIDALGALLTGSTLAVVALQFPLFLGLPAHILFILAGIAFSYSIYSFCCYHFFPRNWQPFLKAIMIANTFYIVVTTVLLFIFLSSVTIWGLLYFPAEMIVIGLLVYVERKALLSNR